MGQVGWSRAASWIALMAAALTFRPVPELSGMHSGQDTLDRASASMLALPDRIVQSEIVVCQAGNPSDGWLYPAWQSLVYK